MRGYYHWYDGLSIEEISARWSSDDDDAAKLFDGEAQTQTGAWFHGMYHWSDLWPYREDDRPLVPALLASVDEHDGFFEPVHLMIGWNGGIRLGEGNHRLQVARELDMWMPVTFHFVPIEETPTDASRYARRPEVLAARQKTRELTWQVENLAAREPLTPERQAQIEEILDLLEVRDPLLPLLDED